MPCPPLHPPKHPPLAPCPAALSCLCSHHNKPGADGALLRLADGDRQAPAANRLQRNQLTALGSARCFDRLSSPSVGGAGAGGGDGSGSAEEYRGLELSLQTAPCLSPGRPGTDWTHKRQIAANNGGLCEETFVLLPVDPFDAEIWMKEPCARERRTGMPTRLSYDSKILL
ncbi:hypothetical protein Q5P01_002091 [Channa striata]|uniref:Uncharacterized protein n=1 Tax=Channa striata TaxID=64152 RepID=A0AA88NSM0_CHASR|nr:hypothetical protein Q5P01_002091 [Channa striata]